MLQFFSFVIIFGIMMYIWSFVYLNKSGDKINQAFLALLCIIMVWMILSVNQNFIDQSVLSVILNTIYWFSMLNIAIFFLFFVYRLVNKKIDIVFYSIVILNEFTILSRFLFPIDYSKQNFWRLNNPIVAPLMTIIFSLPAVFGLFLLILQYRITSSESQKKQFGFIGIGIGIALFISVISESILPILFGINTHLSLMYISFAVFVITIFVAVMRHRLLNLQADYIYRKLLTNAMDGVVIINKNNRIIYINDIAKEILKKERIDIGDKITEYISNYDFAINYKQQEFTIKSENHVDYLTITQFPIDNLDHEPVKLMSITDITLAKLKLKREKEILLQKSSIDQLTGLYNKQYCIDAYGKEFLETSDTLLTILFIDVDDFKSINDIYGHIFGDLVLKSIAVCIKDIIGGNALVARFGGDEFLIILQKNEINEIFAMAEEIRRKVDEIDFSDENLKITLSIGIAEGHPPIKELIMKADTAMYNSKSSGKNRTTVFNYKNESWE